MRVSPERSRRGSNPRSVARLPVATVAIPMRFLRDKVPRNDFVGLPRPLSWPRNDNSSNYVRQTNRFLARLSFFLGFFSIF